MNKTNPCDILTMEHKKYCVQKYHKNKILFFYNIEKIIFNSFNTLLFVIVVWTPDNTFQD